MFTRILVPLDGSSFGAYALPGAVALARRTGAMLDLVHVCAPDDDLTGLTIAKERLEAEADRIREEAAISVVTYALSGAVAPTLLEHLDRGEADFIVMSTHGRGGVKPFRIGSVAQELVRHAEVPLLLMRPESDSPSPPAEPAFEHVLVPLDGSGRSEQVIPVARAIVSPFGSDVTLLRVIEHGRLWPMNALEVQFDDRLRKEEYTSYLTAAAARTERLWPYPEIAVASHATTARGILAAADEVGADLIAMATHGRTGVARLMLGSVANAVLHDTRLPLLLLGPAADPGRFLPTAGQDEEALEAEVLRGEAMRDEALQAS